MNRQVVARIWGVILFLFLFANLTQTAQATPTSFDWGSFNSGGSTTFGVYDSNNSTILQTGDLAQFIWAGPDSIIAPPRCDGTPGGDDQLLDMSTVNNGAPLPPPLQNKGYVPLKTYSYDDTEPQQGGVVFIRAWNASTPAAATAYGDSGTGVLTNGGVLNISRWFTNLAANTSWNGPANGDWHMASNWTGGIVPSAGSNVSILMGSALLNANAATGCLNVASGAAVNLSNFDLTAEDVVMNDGILRQAKSVNNTTQEFLHLTNIAGTVTKYRGVDITTTNNLGNVTISVRAINPGSGEYCTTNGAGSPVYAERCYTITAQNSNVALVRLWALNSELQGIPPVNLTVFRLAAGSWQELTTNATTGNDGGNYVYAQSETPGFSDFLLAESGNNPTALSIANVSAQANSPINSSLSLWGVVGLVVLGTGITVRFLKKRKHKG